ncbi:hypothetical protein [Roseomonas elaeocarpi]|uniref:Uncharacterized protein n=1 Tax=Roseomonas elaeocarpi TaxID=907779 RepID=A0ABV6JVH0_9PROT
MSATETQADPGFMENFLDLAGKPAWLQRVAEISETIRNRTLGARAAQQRHAMELALARLCAPSKEARSGDRAERCVTTFAREAVQLAANLPPGPRERFRELLAAGLTGQANLIPLFHMLRVAALQRSRGFEVHHAGLLDGAAFDLLIRRDGAEAEIVCDTMSAEEGRPLHRTGWCALVDRVNPDLHTWLSAHPGRYVLKMTLPEGLKAPDHVAELHRRITAMLSARSRQDTDADAVLKLDPLLLAGAQAELPSSLRAQFGPDAHLAVAGNPAGGSVFVLAARSGRENDIAAAVCRRLVAATERLSGTRPGILSIFLDDLEPGEWRGLRDRLELEGAVRRFLTTAEARKVVAVTCASRMELLEVQPPAGVAEGEMRYRNPSHPQAKLGPLQPAIASSL